MSSDVAAAVAVAVDVAVIWPHLASSELIRAHLASSGLISPHQSLAGLIWPHLSSSGVIWPHLASSGLIWPHLASSGLIWRHLASSGLIWPYLASSGLIWLHLASSGLRWPHRLLDDFAVCSMRRFLPEASSGFRWPYRLLDDFAVCSMVPLVYDSVFFCMVSFLLDEDAASIHGIYCWQRAYNRIGFLYELELFSSQASIIKKHHHRCFMCVCMSLLGLLHLSFPCTGKSNYLARRVYPPSSGRHAMRYLYVIGRDGWVVGGSKVLARPTFLPRSGSRIRNRRVSPRWWFIAASPG